jgi:hypothetical protein
MGITRVVLNTTATQTGTIHTHGNRRATINTETEHATTNTEYSLGHKTTTDTAHHQINKPYTRIPGKNMKGSPEVANGFPSMNSQRTRDHRVL